MVDHPDDIKGPDIREGNLAQKVCILLHLRLLKEDDIYPLHRVIIGMPCDSYDTRSSDKLKQ